MVAGSWVAEMTRDLFLIPQVFENQFPCIVYVLLGVFLSNEERKKCSRQSTNVESCWCTSEEVTNNESTWATSLKIKTLNNAIPILFST